MPIPLCWSSSLSLSRLCCALNMWYVKYTLCVHSNKTEYRDFGSNQNNTSGIACVLFPSEFPDKVSRHATPSGDASLATLAHDTAGGTRTVADATGRDAGATARDGPDPLGASRGRPARGL